ncbi:hypothetical protein CVT26_002753 [Gymnopilus dilepis]|uniref:Exonuclease domain-containing protein n=1 Tax=Gymnopilus dilepis TaxID=231916 RepID=A0A409VC76_9AGAR|nr:hypothetical protein CVT26_002753 [Gymnopilus dilepis]
MPVAASALTVKSGSASSSQRNPVSHPPSRRRKKKMRYKNRGRSRPITKQPILPTEVPQSIPRTKQPFEAFLVLDIEGTCMLGTDFNYPNEIIELPVVLLQWKDRDEFGTATNLELVDEFRTFVRPTWRPKLSDFCMELTGITQEQVDAAPLFRDVLVDLEAFLVKHGLIEEGTRQRLRRFCWCTDGPWDIRDFIVKQCFISKVLNESRSSTDDKGLADRCTRVQLLMTLMVPFLIRLIVIARHDSAISEYLYSVYRRSKDDNIAVSTSVLKPVYFSCDGGDKADPAMRQPQDTRNIAKIITELARRGVPLLPNTTIYPGRRWRWMGKYGQILEDALP